ncbi:unnamed protein product, partial [Ixodes persulcatus]
MVTGGPPSQQSPLFVYDPATVAALAVAMYHAAINYQALSAAVAAVSNQQPRVPSPAAPPPEARIFLTYPMQIPLPAISVSGRRGGDAAEPGSIVVAAALRGGGGHRRSTGKIPGREFGRSEGSAHRACPLPEYEGIPRVAPSPVQEQTQLVIYPPARHMPPTSMSYA